MYNDDKNVNPAIVDQRCYQKKFVKIIDRSAWFIFTQESESERIFGTFESRTFSRNKLQL